MPIEIRELVIRATVDPAAAGAGDCGASSKPGKDQPSARAEPDVVQSCVREVLRILEEKRER